ncbi:MAG: hypothetical protein Q8N88_03955 [Nanoarchaeota archaeon]|nr:hypothetical protein [Nanoarchaeota archaeon]
MKNLANLAVRRVGGALVGLAALVGGCVEDEIMGPLVMTAAQQTIVSGVQNGIEGPRSPTINVNNPNPNMQSVQNHGYAQAKRPRYPLVFTSNGKLSDPLFRFQEEFEVGEKIYFHVNLQHYPNMPFGTRIKVEFVEDNGEIIEKEILPYSGCINSISADSNKKEKGEVIFYVCLENKWREVASTKYKVE